MIAITLGTIAMNTGTADADGAVWYVTKWTGWDSPNLRQSTLDPSFKDGTIITESVYGPRMIQIDGVCKANSLANYWIARDKIAKVVGVRTNADLVVSETVDKVASVRLSSGVKISEIGQGSFEWSLALIAPDPRKYAVTPTVVTVASGDSEVLTNSGTVVTFPFVEGDPGDFEVGNTTTGLTFFSGSFGADTDPYEFDFTKRTAYSGDDSRFGYVTPNAVWWGLEPGANTIQNNSDNDVEITFRSAWI